MTEVALAILVRPDGGVRQVCVGCTMRLIELGMVTLVAARPLNDRQPEYVTATYRIAQPHTMNECRMAIADRHVGPPWGE